MATGLTVLKLGGSVITNKEREFAPSRRSVSRLMKEIRASAPESLIIVHGGGSFGHHLAKRYRLSDGYRDRSQIDGFVRTRQSMTELNKLILDSAIQNHLPCVSLQPSAFTKTRRGRVERMDLHIATGLLKLHLIPLLFGDVVLDEEIGFCVLSGDQLASRLAIELAAEQIVLAVDVDGVFDSDPKQNPKAKLLRRMTSADVRRLVQEGEAEAKGADVTGRMVGKLREMLLAVERGLKVIIVNGNAPGRVSQALKGFAAIGTVIER